MRRPRFPDRDPDAQDLVLRPDIQQESAPWSTTSRTPRMRRHHRDRRQAGPRSQAGRGEQAARTLDGDADPADSLLRHLRRGAARPGITETTLTRAPVSVPCAMGAGPVTGSGAPPIDDTRPSRQGSKRAPGWRNFEPRSGRGVPRQRASPKLRWPRTKAKNHFRVRDSFRLPGFDEQEWPSFFRAWHTKAQAFEVPAKGLGI